MRSSLLKNLYINYMITPKVIRSIIFHDRGQNSEYNCTSDTMTNMAAVGNVRPSSIIKVTDQLTYLKN